MDLACFYYVMSSGCAEMLQLTRMEPWTGASFMHPLATAIQIINKVKSVLKSGDFSLM